MKTLRFLGAALGASVLASAASAQFNTIARESFDYADGSAIDQANGDLGWFQQWFAGCCFGGSSAGFVTSPGFDAVGHKLTMTANNEGAFRGPHTGTYKNSISTTLNYGDDGSTIWVSFTTSRTPGADNRYGGLSLHTSFVGEKLFLGAPFDAFEWGVGGGATVAGSNIDTPSRLVYRIDYQPGDERLRMWLNPSVPHPVSTPDIDQTVGDHTWNEIRLQGGEGPSFNSWEFDDILIEAEGADPNLEVNTNALSASIGGTQTMIQALGDSHAGSLYIVLGTTSGTSPGFPFGSSVIPLNIDAYFNLTLNNPNSALMPKSFGTLDAIGWAFVDFNLPAGSSASLVGLGLDHVLCEIQVAPTLDVPFIFTPAHIDIVP